METLEQDVSHVELAGENKIFEKVAEHLQVVLLRQVAGCEPGFEQWTNSRLGWVKFKFLSPIFTGS